MPHDSELIALGIQHHESGRFLQALQLYGQALADDPQNPRVLSLMGAVCINLRQWQQADQYLREALRAGPDHASAHDNFGVLLAKQGRLAEAVDNFRRAAELDPRNPQTQLNLANALTSLGENDAAIRAFHRVVTLAPNSARAHAQLAQALYELDRLDDALPHFRQAALLKKDDPAAYFELATVLSRCARTDEAIAAYREVFRLKPDSAEACVNLSQLHIAKASYDEAVDWARRAIRLRPRFAEAHLNLGSALTKQERFAEAAAALGEAARLKPELVQTHNNLGVVATEEGRFAEAAAHYRQALALQPDSADAFYNFGIALYKQGQTHAAIEQFDRALQHRPDYAEAHHNRAAAWLLLGDLARGLPEYEWRFGSRDFAPFRPRWKVWEGEPIAERTIVLCAEQGLGDTLQFVRYAKVLQARGARVLVDCPKSLHAILARTPGVDSWVSDETDAAADFCLSLLSAPYRLQTTPETIPAEIPYVFADAELVASWRAKLATFDGIRVGIAWQGNPRCPGDRHRSIPLAEFAALAGLPGVRLISLQKGPGSDQIGGFSQRWPIVDFGAQLDDDRGAFMDTAAIMMNVDLVITSDTATAHLAGALGVPVWVALQTVPDWRWMLERGESPWYPTMRLFRQTTPGDWGTVFRSMVAELAARTG